MKFSIITFFIFFVQSFASANNRTPFFKTFEEAHNFLEDKANTDLLTLQSPKEQISIALASKALTGSFLCISYEAEKLPAMKSIYAYFPSSTEAFAVLSINHQKDVNGNHGSREEVIARLKGQSIPLAVDQNKKDLTSSVFWGDENRIDIIFDSPHSWTARVMDINADLPSYFRCEKYFTSISDEGA